MATISQYTSIGSIRENQVLKYWVLTSQGKFGPYDTQFLAESASHSVPKQQGEVPRIVPLTESGQQLLLG